MAIVASLVGMFLVNTRLALIIIAAMPIMVLVSVVFQKQILKYQRKSRRLNSMITSSFNEGIMGARTTKTLVREELNNRDMFALTDRMRRASMRAITVSALYMPVASLVISIAIGLVLNRGGFYVLGGYITIGQLNFFITIGNFMFEPIRNFSRIFAELQTSQAAAERVAEVLDARSDIIDPDEIVAKYGDMFEAKTENWEPIEEMLSLETYPLVTRTGKRF